MNRIKEEILALQFKLLQIELFSIHTKICELEQSLRPQSKPTCCVGFPLRCSNVK